MARRTRRRRSTRLAGTEAYHREQGTAGRTGVGHELVELDRAARAGKCDYAFTHVLNVYRGTGAALTHLKEAGLYYGSDASRYRSDREAALKIFKSACSVVRKD